MSSTSTTPATGCNYTKADNPIPPWNRLAVDASTACAMLSCSRSTFFARIRAGIYPKPKADGRWSVAELRALYEPAAA